MLSSLLCQPYSPRVNVVKDISKNACQFYDSHNLFVLKPCKVNDKEFSCSNGAHEPNRDIQLHKKNLTFTL